MKNVKHLACTSLFLFAFSACTSKPKEEPKKAAAPTMSIEAKQVAAEQEATHVAEIKFSKGSSQLSQEAKSQLQKLIASSKKSGKVDKFQIVSWSDREYPSDTNQDLPPKDQRLAKQRNKAIETYIKSHAPKTSVESFSMAERPQKFSQWLQNDEARIKDSLANSGISTQGKTQSDSAKASHSIIMVDLE